MSWGVLVTMRKLRASCRDCEYRDEGPRSEITAQAHAQIEPEHTVEVERCEVTSIRAPRVD